MKSQLPIPVLKQVWALGMQCLGGICIFVSCTVMLVLVVSTPIEVMKRGREAIR